MSEPGMVRRKLGDALILYGAGLRPWERVRPFVKTPHRMRAEAFGWRILGNRRVARLLEAAAREARP